MNKFAVIKIRGVKYTVYAWDSIPELNKRHEATSKKYMAYPQNYKAPTELYGCDAFICPVEKEIHFANVYNKNIILKNLAHEISHGIFFEKDKIKEYENEEIVEACAEIYMDIYETIKPIREALER